MSNLLQIVFESFSERVIVEKNAGSCFHDCYFQGAFSIEYFLCVMF